MRTCWRGLLMVCLVLGRFGPELAADTIRLKDGSVHHGKKLGSSARKIGFQVDGKLQWFERRDVLSVEINDKGKDTKPKSTPRVRPTPRPSRPERPAHGSGSGSWRVTRVEVRSTASSGSQFSMSSGIAPFLYVYLRFPKAPGVGTLCSLGVVDLRGRSAGKLWGWKNGTDALLIFEGDWSRLSQFTLVGIGRRVNLGRSDTGAPTVRRPRPKPKPKTRGKKKSEPETPSGKPYEVVRKFEHPEGVTGVAFGPDGATLLTGCKNGEAMLWNVADGKKLRVLSGHVKGVNAVAFSPDGSKVVTGSEDNTAVIWNAATGKRLHRLGDHKGAVSAVAFSPDGSLIVTGSADKSVLVWDAATGKRRRRIGLLVNPVKCLAFWPRSKKVVIGTGSVGKGLLAIVGKENTTSVPAARGSSGPSRVARSVTSTS